VLWRRSLLVCALLTIAPLFLTRHLPFCDLPEHVAVISTLRHWWDPAWRSQELYTFAGATKTQYLLYYGVGALLAVPFGNAETANLAMLCAAGLGFPYALRALLRALRGDERLAVFACPLFWNRALAEGLVNYVVSIPIAVWGIALAVEQAERPTRKRFAGLAVLGLSLFYLHLSGFIVFDGGAAIVTAFLPRRNLLALPKLPKRVAWMAPAALASIAFALTSALTHPAKSQARRPASFASRRSSSWPSSCPRGGKLLTLVFAQRSAYTHIPPFVHFGAYYRIRYGGIASFSELPHWPVQYRPGEAPPAKKTVFWDWSPCLYRNTKDGPYYDFILSRGDLDPFANDPPGPRWRTIGGAGEWRLWSRDPGPWSPKPPDADRGPCAPEDEPPR
jgi:hypothetical protein